MKKIILLALPLALALSPINMVAQVEHESIETTTSGVTVTVNGNVVRISGAAGEVMKVFNLTGAEVATIRIEGSEKTVTLSIPKGCYLLKVGKLVRKIYIR
ncbi:MAG: T9SS type A sorting domain-containing protein [Bacteroidaceae bacterium]